MTDRQDPAADERAERSPLSVRRLLGDAIAAPLNVARLLSQAVESSPMRPPAPTIPGAPPTAMPVSYNFFSGIGPEIRHPGGSLPGSNRWGVRPSAERPVPVVLAHGTGGGAQTNWGTYVPLLANAGYSVFSLTYGALPGSRWPISAIGGMAPIEDSAAEFGRFVDRVLESTGAEQVDVVGHSQGALMPNYYARFLGGAPKIRKYISLAPLWRGTTAFGVDVWRRLDIRLGVNPMDAIPCHSAAQMAAGSDFITKMNAPIQREPGVVESGPYVPGIEYTNISTRRDEFVVPYTSGQVEPGPGDTVTNIVVQTDCPKDYSDHLGIAGSPRAARMVLNALDPASFQDVPCLYVPPFFG